MSLYGCYVNPRAAEGRWAKTRIGPIGGKGLGQTEVQYLDLHVGCHLDVGWLQVPMDDALSVRRFEGFRNLKSQLVGFFDRDGATFQGFSQRVAFDEFEDEEARTVYMPAEACDSDRRRDHGRRPSVVPESTLS